jgi:ER lumen protein retaining receptor
LALKVYSTGSISGLSKNSIICYLICLVFRSLAIFLFDGYLPYDSTGDFIYRISEYVSLFSCAFVYYLMKFKFSKSYNHDLDTFKWYYFVIPTAILAVLIHPNLNSSFFGDFIWTFALYLESVAMFP